MKNYFLLFGCMALLLGACRHECPGEDEAIRQGVHYFYVDNRLDEDIVLEFNTLAFDTLGGVSNQSISASPSF